MAARMTSTPTATVSVGSGTRPVWLATTRLPTIEPASVPMTASTNDSMTTRAEIVEIPYEPKPRRS